MENWLQDLSNEKYLEVMSKLSAAIKVSQKPMFVTLPPLNSDHACNEVMWVNSSSFIDDSSECSDISDDEKIDKSTKKNLRKSMKKPLTLSSM